MLLVSACVDVRAEFYGFLCDRSSMDQQVAQRHYIQDTGS